MRAGSCTVQQGLTVEAANVVKQALALARRRGHAQVTPLHVANVMLSTSNGLLRTACLQSHSHPLQCKALELCFNVALNRLPASSSGPMLTAHHSQQHPTISNALVAAFKRAQAHQRRGSVENQQQPILAVKIELEQLIISILDDPSVSRVMREAGFNSTQVKSNVEQAVSLELCSQDPPHTPPRNKSKENCNNVFKASKSINPPAKDEDVVFVLESLMKRRRRSVVIVGECISSLEGVVGGMMEQVEKLDADDSVKGLKFVSVSLNTFGNLQREEVEQKVGELSCLVRSLVGKGVILYLGDLKWIIDYRAEKQGRNSCYYCPVEHMIMELGRLIYGMGENIGRLWLMGIATFQTFMKCRNGQHSLKSIWGLHPITLPAASLDLSLNMTESTGSEIESSRSKIAKSSSCHQPLLGSTIGNGNAATTILETEVGSTKSLPSWLKDESKRLKNNESVQQKQTITSISSSPSPSSSTSFFSYDQQLSMELRENAWQMTTSTPNSASSSDLMDTDYIPRFKEFNAENLNILCNALEKKVPWQKEIVTEIAGAILQCRSGMLKRKEAAAAAKEETWLFFQGLDGQAKERIARELAKVVFGSYSNFVAISLSSFSSSRAESTEDCFKSCKRLRDEKGCDGSYVARLSQEICANPHRVFLVEDMEQADFQSQMAIKRAIERGKIRNVVGDEEVSLCDAIVVLSCESFSSGSRACSPPVKQKLDESSSSCVSLSLDLNISINDDIRVEDPSIDDIGILEIVDRRIVFKMHELLL